MSDLKKEGKEVVLCCGRQRCPQLRIENGKVVITDDNGVSIEMEKDQASLIPQAIKMIDG